jgi:hypothetical protein
MKIKIKKQSKKNIKTADGFGIFKGAPKFEREEDPFRKYK